MLGARIGEEPPGSPVVLGLPRGGVPVAAEVANAIDAPLDVLVVRKLGVPGHDEVAMGAVGEDGAIVLNPAILDAAGVSEAELRRVERRERAEVLQRVDRFRSRRPAVGLSGRTAVVVDDGIATGATARVACRIARARGAERVVMAAPVAAPDVLDSFEDADAVVCLLAPRSFMSVGLHYLDFTQVEDAEVIEILEGLRRG